MEVVGGVQAGVLIETLVRQNINSCDQVLVAVAYCSESPERL